MDRFDALVIGGGPAGAGMNFILRGLATAVPDHTMTQSEATDLAKTVICRNEQQRRLLSALYRKSGVQNRYTVLPHRIALEWLPNDSQANSDRPESETMGPTTGERMKFYAEQATPLALRAARAALADANISASTISHLVTISCTGFDAPGVDTQLIRQLCLPPSTQRVHVGFMGCHGAINGLRVAQSIAASDPEARVLMCAVELCSLHYRFCWDPERIVANALFADGAAAIVGFSGPAEPNALSVRATGSCLLPDSTDAMTWKVGDHGFEMTLSAVLPELIQQHLRPWLETWLRKFGYSLETVGSWAIHPGGPRILNSVESSLSLSDDATRISRQVLAQHGNMSSPTVLFILNQLRSTQAPRPCVALGFGPGVFAEAALLE